MAPNDNSGASAAPSAPQIATPQIVPLKTTINEVLKPSAFRDPDMRRPIYATPQGWVLHDMAPFMSALPPESIKREYEVADTKSFVDYYNRFKANPTVTASLAKRTLSAVLNDHTDAATKDFANHVLSRKFEATRALTRILGQNRKALGQTQFALFLEDNAKLVAEPPKGELLKMVLTFKALKNFKLDSSVDLQNGDVNLSFISKTGTETGQALLPEQIKFALPLFQGETLNWELPARLKYKVDPESGGVNIWYELIEVEDLLDDAFKDALLDLQGLVDKPIALIP